jgi:hypothetical protein
LRRAAAIAILLLIAVAQGYTGQWARGYFYQVTALRGRVVGANIGPLQYVRWLRQSFARKHAKLTLYEYRWPVSGRSALPFVKAIETDPNGRFDFGLMKTGHYTLVVDDEKLSSSNWFDVEMKDRSLAKESVIIDVSPHFPDCKGGHEFIVKTK